jgi:hypothetical protein
MPDSAQLRFARYVPKLADCVRSIQELAALGVRFVAITQNIDTDESNPAARLLLHIFAAFAEFERELIRERFVTRPRNLWQGNLNARLVVVGQDWGGTPTAHLRRIRGIRAGTHPGARCDRHLRHRGAVHGSGGPDGYSGGTRPCCCAQRAEAGGKSALCSAFHSRPSSTPAGRNSSPNWLLGAEFKWESRLNQACRSVFSRLRTCRSQGAVRLPASCRTSSRSGTLMRGFKSAMAGRYRSG